MKKPKKIRKKKIDKLTSITRLTDKACELGYRQGLMDAMEIIQKKSPLFPNKVPLLTAWTIRMCKLIQQKLDSLNNKPVKQGELDPDPSVHE